MTVAGDLRALSATSRWLLLTKLFVSTALFMLTPFLVVGVAGTTDMGVGGVSAALLVAMVLGNVAGLGLAARASRNDRRWLVACCGGLTAAPLALALAGSIPGGAVVVLVTAAFVLLRCSFAVFFTVSKAIHLSSNVGGVPTSTVFTFVGGAFAVGTALGPVLGVAVLAAADHEALYVGSALLFLIAGVVTRCAPHAPTGNDAPGAGTRDALRRVSGHPPLAALLLAAFLLHVLLAQTFSYLPLVLHADNEDGEAVTATFFTTHAILMIALPLAIIGLVQRVLSSPSIRYAAGSVLVAGALWLLGLRTESWVPFAAAVLAISLGELLATANSMELLRRTSPPGPALTGTVALYTFVCSGLGLGLGQFAGTALFENASRSVTGATWLVVGLVSALLGAWAGRPHPRGSAANGERVVNPAGAPSGDPSGELTSGERRT